ncbi:hypothetical protein T08_7116 [Trichinella sp. T8]|nr:hypothetical protein T08_7116 [Trichinella sp. T8]
MFILLLFTRHEQFFPEALLTLDKTSFKSGD